MGNKMRYQRVFMQGSPQFCGHIDEYFMRESEELLVLIVPPRVGEHRCLARYYRDGRLLEERPLRSSQKSIPYYLLWYINYVRLLLAFSKRNEETLILSGHPIMFFGGYILKLLRPLTYVFWIGDYFPECRLTIRLYEALKRWLQKRVAFTFYLSDAINRVMNGGIIINTDKRRTVMWGVKPWPAQDPPPLEPFTLLFVGLIRQGQGLEQLFTFLSQQRAYRLRLIGVGAPEYIAALERQVEKLHLANRVYFPNRFFSQEELLAEARLCHVGMALYDTTASNFTHYADPGKVKAYAEMHLPVVMTRISDIAPIVEVCGSGVVIAGVDELEEALVSIREKYAHYRSGVQRFNARFEYMSYYNAAFKGL